MNLETSPLTEPDKNSLATLFARDPLKLTREDVQSICVELRKQREKWMLDEVKKANKPKKAALSAGEMDDLLNSL